MARPFVKNLAHLPVTPGAANGTMTLENPGDVEAYPIWELRGPGKNFRAISPRGEVLEWLGTLAADETLVIDTQAGTVLDGKGENRYAELGETPRMWTIPPGETVAEIQFEATSSGVYEPGATLRTNYALDSVPVGPANGHVIANFAGNSPGGGESGDTITSATPQSTADVATNNVINPSFETSATVGWATSSCTLTRVTSPTRPQRVGNYMGMIQTPAEPTGTVYVGTFTHTDFPTLLTPGAGQWVGASILMSRSTGPQYARVSIQWYKGTAAVHLTHGAIGLLSAGGATRFTVVGQAPAEATSARLIVYPQSTSTGGAPQEGNTQIGAAMLCGASTEAEALAAAEDYVDGSIPTLDLPGDVRYVPAFTGTAHASASTRTLTITPGAKGPAGAPGFARRVVTAEKSSGSTGWTATGSVYRAPLSGTAGDQVTVSVWARLAYDPAREPGTVHRTVRLRTQPYLGNSSLPHQDTSAIVLPANEWVRLHKTYLAASAFDSVAWWVYQTSGSNLPAGTTFDIAALLIEPGGDLRSWFYGAMASGSRGVYAFAGAVNASISHMYSAVLRGASRVAVSWRARKWMVI